VPIICYSVGMIGQEIKELRQRLKLEQTALAEKLGCTSQAVSNWENGRSHPHKMFRKKLEELKNEIPQATQ
jgi:DNA-binding transcriptional regulator YiaG